MTVKECYEKIGGDYDEIVSRLGNEERVIRFSKKFFDTGDMENLEKCIDQNDGDNSFEYAHRLKGNSLNIGFTHFSKTVESLVEPLRCREIKDRGAIDVLFSVVKDEYTNMKEVFNQLN